MITILEDEAIAQAKQADAEIAAGKYRGPLHGIPYGVKDLLAVEGHKTTWGAEPYKDQVIDETATVVKKINEAGGVLLAKLTMGALARGDVWYGRCHQESMESKPGFKWLFSRFSLSNICRFGWLFNWNGNIRLNCITINPLWRFRFASYLWKSQPYRSYGP